MSAIRFQDYVDDRADQLNDDNLNLNLNGLKLILISLPPGPTPDHALLEVHFYNQRHMEDIKADIAQALQASQT